jgi:hypothetical protein
MAVALVTALALTAHVALEAVDVKVDHDKSFDFRAVRTWGWNPEGAGDVKMARTKDDDPEAMKKRVDPLMREAVTAEMTRRGLKESSAPDLTVTYFLLLTSGSSSQTVGQFLPATAAWGLPMFPAATQSLEMMNRGSLVIDLSAKGTVVWRGVAQSKVEIGLEDKKREDRLREGVRDLLKRYPPK